MDYSIPTCLVADLWSGGHHSFGDRWYHLSFLAELKFTEHLGNSVDNNITCSALLNSKFIEHFGNSIDNNITCPALLNSKFTEHFGNSVYVPVCMFTLQGRKLTGFESGGGVGSGVNLPKQLKTFSDDLSVRHMALLR